MVGRQAVAVSRSAARRSTGPDPDPGLRKRLWPAPTPCAAGRIRTGYTRLRSPSGG